MKKLVFTGATEEQTRWGGNTDPTGILVEGETYTVDRIETHSWHTRIFLKGINGYFNSVCFSKEPTQCKAMGVNTMTDKLTPEQAAALAVQLEKQPYTYYGKDGRPVLARDLEDQLEAAKTRIAELEEALEPFADATDDMEGYDDYNQAPVTVGQCRAARAALGGEIATETDNG